MRILLCIDDTDNLDSRGTGDLAKQIAQTIEENSWGKCSGITRHQLLIHPDVPYTSHNSSMCFEAHINEIYLSNIIEFSSSFLEKESAEGSDPGLCIAAVNMILSPGKLIEFGRKAKKELVRKEEAYGLARELGIHLSEHGGTGQGIIGALAGTGLRLTGNDGRLKGKIQINSIQGLETVDYIISNSSIENVKDINGNYLQGDEIVIINNPLKAVYLKGKFVLLVNKKDNILNGGRFWEPCSKNQLKAF